jgi:hypothetical protein
VSKVLKVSKANRDREVHKGSLELEVTEVSVETQGLQAYVVTVSPFMTTAT